MDFQQVYKKLFACYGQQHWWPGDSPFEIMVGAILTQNTAWTNVERAIANLKSQSCLAPDKILDAPEKKLAEWIKPSGYFNVKAKRLRNFCQWYIDYGELASLSKVNTHELRKWLLSVNGVGPETADDILLYAFGRPVFVIDAYTRRIFSRLELVNSEGGYETLRQQFETALHADAEIFNEYHALIVRHGKDVCKTPPLCSGCCLADVCPSQTGSSQKV